MSRKSTQIDTMQEDVSQKAVQVSICDYSAKKYFIREESSFVLVDSAFVSEVSGVCVQVENKEYPILIPNSSKFTMSLSQLKYLIQLHSFRKSCMLHLLGFFIMVT